MEPKYKHDCSACRYLGTGKVQILGDGEFDFYVCGPDDDRSFIARYGDDGPDYSSCPLFGCAELTSLDKVALANGLELTPLEEGKLLKVFARLWKDKLTMGNYMDMTCTIELGKGNIVFNY